MPCSFSVVSAVVFAFSASIDDFKVNKDFIILTWKTHPTHRSKKPYSFSSTLVQLPMPLFFTTLLAY